MLSTNAVAVIGFISLFGLMLLRVPIAMPTGTRSSISVNSETNPMTATALVLIPDYSVALILGSCISSGWKISR